MRDKKVKHIFPRKYKKEIVNIVNEFLASDLIDSDYFSDWNTFLNYQQQGAEDGWLKYTNREYQALMWLRYITEFVNDMQYRKN